MNRLGIKATTIKRVGSVSKDVAREMAIGIRKRAGSDYAISITGIAGPEGGTTEKPVGLVYMGVAGPRKAVVQEFRFRGPRDVIRTRAALMALELLRKEILIK